MNETLEPFLAIWFITSTFPYQIGLFWGAIIGLFAAPALVLTRWARNHYPKTNNGNEIYWGRVFVFISIPWVIFVGPIASKAFTLVVDWYPSFLRSGSQIVILMAIAGAAMHYLGKHTDYLSPTASSWIRWFNIFVIFGFIGACYSLLPGGGCYYEVGANGAIGRLC